MTTDWKTTVLRVALSYGWIFLAHFFPGFLFVHFGTYHCFLASSQELEPSLPYLFFFLVFWLGDQGGSADFNYSFRAPRVENMTKTTSTRSFPSLTTVIGSEVVLGLVQTNLSQSQDFFAGVRRYGILEQNAFSFVLNMKEDTC